MFSDSRKTYTGFNFIGRLKALGVHLIFSLIVFAVFMYVMLLHWFPQPHFSINGGWQGMRIMIMVDLIIGPVITFFLYNNRKSKKELRFDLGLIVCIQIGLIIYGIMQIYSQRPVVQVLSHRGYIATAMADELIYDKNIKPQQYIESMNVFNTSPVFVYSKFKSHKQLLQLINKAKNKPFANLFQSNNDNNMGEFSPEIILSRYEPFNSPLALTKLKQIAVDSKIQLLRDDINKKAIGTFEQNNPNNIYYFFPLKAKYGEAIIVLNEIGKPVDYLAIKLIE